MATSLPQILPADKVPDTEEKVALVTGAGRRIGAEIARQLHGCGYRLALHCRRSISEARALADEFNRCRPGSAAVFQGELCQIPSVQAMAEQILGHFGRVDALVNNASSFYPTPLESASEDQWHELIGSNLMGPYFLCRALAPGLKTRAGSVVNIADIHARQPLRNHSIYCIAKAGNVMLTKSLALELSPAVRVNGIAPGAILWPEAGSAAQAIPGATAGAGLSESAKQSILDQVPLQRTGSPADIAGLARFLIVDAGYLTGQIIAVDGGRSSSF